MPRATPLFSIEPQFRINWGPRFRFGPGKADLLEQIDRTGSISEAAAAMSMSYMRAWSMVKSLDRAFAEPLVRKIRGGHTRGGAQLTPTGREVVRIYRSLVSNTKRPIGDAQRKLTALMKAKRPGSRPRQR